MVKKSRARVGDGRLTQAFYNSDTKGNDSRFCKRVHNLGMADLLTKTIWFREILCFVIPGAHHRSPQHTVFLCIRRHRHHRGKSSVAVLSQFPLVFEQVTIPFCGNPGEGAPGAGRIDEQFRQTVFSPHPVSHHSRPASTGKKCSGPRPAVATFSTPSLAPEQGSSGSRPSPGSTAPTVRRTASSTTIASRRVNFCAG